MMHAQTTLGMWLRSRLTLVYVRDETFSEPARARTTNQSAPRSRRAARCVNELELAHVRVQKDLRGTEFCHLFRERRSETDARAEALRSEGVRDLRVKVDAVRFLHPPGNCSRRSPGETKRNQRVLVAPIDRFNFEAWGPAISATSLTVGSARVAAAGSGRSNARTSRMTRSSSKPAPMSTQTRARRPRELADARFELES